MIKDISSINMKSNIAGCRFQLWFIVLLAIVSAVQALPRRPSTFLVRPQAQELSCSSLAQCRSIPILRGGAEESEEEDDEEAIEDTDTEEEDEDDEEETANEDDTDESEYDDEYDNEYDDEDEEEEESVAEKDDSEYEEPYVISPQIQLYTMFGSMILSNKVSLFTPKVVKLVRFLFVAQLVLQQIFIFYVRIMAKKNNDRTPVSVKNPLSDMLQKQMGGQQEMVKNLASSFLSSETTIMEYDMKQASSMQGGILFNLAFMWFLHFKLEKVQPLLMQIVTGTMQLIYNPLFQVYVLGRNLERPFKTAPSAAQKMMEAQQQQKENEAAETAEDGEEENEDEATEESDTEEEVEESDDDDDEETEESSDDEDEAAEEEEAEEK